jgi:spore coat polysaccharide biosynthesis predicted glycosyltransferase SpsG
MSALGAELISRGAELDLVVARRGDVPPALVEGKPWIRFDDWHSQDVTARDFSGIDAVVVDSYLAGAAFYQNLSRFSRLVAIDDYYRLSYPAALVVNPNVYADLGRYSVKSIGGATHVLVRSSISQAHASFNVRPLLKRVLLTLGGRSTGVHARRLVENLRDAGLEVTWLGEAGSARGSGVPQLSPIGAEEFVARVLESDLVVCGGGQTLHEMACLGCPSIAIRVSADQSLNLQYYESIGAIAAPVGIEDGNLSQYVLDSVTSMAGASARQRRANVGQELVDGAGAARVSKRILELTAA